MSATPGPGEPTAPVAVDAAVAAKLVLPEELSNRAHALVEGAFRAGRRVVGPPLLHAEVANAVYQRLRRDDLTAAEAEAAVALLPRLGIEAVAPPELLPEAAAFARKHRLKQVFDAQYAVLARLLGADLWTGDRTLYKKLNPVAPWVRWIGDYDGGG